MPIPPEANVRLKVEADITKRSKPVRSAKAALTRFGSVLWGDDDFFNARSLQVLITHLRRALSKDPRIRIVNVRGTGYKLIAE